jgi:hypothetical protein
MSFVRIDVRDFFPSIDHEHLIGQLQDHGAQAFLITLIEKALKTPTGACSGTNDPIIRGVPQGLSISNILSSVYMHEIDRSQGSCHFFRYVDDILVVCPSQHDTRSFKDIVQRLQALGLDAHPLGKAGKSEIRRVAEGVDYLGYHITRDLVSVRPSSYRKMFANLLRVLTDYKYRSKLEAFIFRLNLKITGCVVDGKRRGWLMFFAQTEDTSQLKYLDKFISRQLTRVGAGDVAPHIKRFVKAYHEIRFKGGISEYIPNFDAYDLDRKIALIAQLSGWSIDELRKQPLAVVDHEFESILNREIAELEQDVIGAIS